MLETFFQRLTIPGTKVVFGGANTVSTTYDLEAKKDQYFTTGIKRDFQHKRAKDADIIAKNHFFLDFDVKKEMPEGSTDSEVLEKCKEILSRLENHAAFRFFALANFTGGGFHVHYIGEIVDLKEDDHKVWKAGVQDIQRIASETAEFEVDLQCCNTSRLCRIPTTWNKKNKVFGSVIKQQLDTTSGFLGEVMDRGRNAIADAEDELALKAARRAKKGVETHDSKQSHYSSTFDLIHERIRIEDLVVNEQWGGNTWYGEERNGGAKIQFFDAKRDRKGCFVDTASNMLINTGCPHFSKNHSPYTFARDILGLDGRDLFAFFENLDPVIRDAAEKSREEYQRERDLKMKEKGEEPISDDDKEKVPKPHVIAEAIMQKQKLFLGDASKLYRYNGSYWEHITEAHIDSMIHSIEKPHHFKTSRVREIKAHIKAKTHTPKTPWRNIKETEVAFANGVFDLHERKVRDHAPHDYLESIIPWEISTGATSKKWTECLELWFDGDEDARDKVLMLQEFFGYCLMPRAKYKKALFLYGVPDSGKSVITKVLQKIMTGVGTSKIKENCCFLPINSLSDRKQIVPIKGAYLNIMNEIASGEKLDDSGFKQLVSTEEPVSIEQKFFPAESYTPFAKHILIGNNRPYVRDLTEASFNRLMILKFNNSVPPELKDVLLDEKLEAEMDGILSWSLAGAVRLWERSGMFTQSASSREEIESYKTDSDPVMSFMKEATVHSRSDSDYISLSIIQDSMSGRERNAWELNKISRHLKAKGFQTSRKYVGGIQTTCVLNRRQIYSEEKTFNEEGLEKLANGGFEIDGSQVGG